jgi:hypothetical protein
MIEMSLQELYNILSIVGFGFCMYKIHKMEVMIELLKTNQLLGAMTSFALTKTLKNKGVIGDEELEMEIKKEEI